MIYGGDSLKMSGFFDSVQEMCQSRLGLKGLAQGDPLFVLLGVMAGIDFFETDYPLELASKNQALILNPIPPQQSTNSLQQIIDQSPPTLALNQSLMLAVLCENSKPNIIEFPKDFTGQEFSQEPLQAGCECYCCKNYTRAYLHHLLDVHEMNFNILIGIHNSYVYDQLFTAL